MIRPLTTLALRAPAIGATVTMLAILLTGCGTAPPAMRHLLPAHEAPAAGAPAAGGPEVAALRLAQIRLPSYLDDAAIAYLRADGTVAAIAGEQWAEDPQQAITRAFGRALRAASGATVIYEPWPIGLESTAAVTVSIHRLLGTPGGETRLSGQFLLVSAQQVLTVRDFDLRAPVRGADTPALLRSYSDALASLADMLAAELR